jgi:ribulose-5-phosphate 4-epimerase/fuculose-1-phosphate aldolase
LHEHIVKYTNKLLRDRTAVPESIRFYVLDDRVVTNREDAWLPVFTGVFAGLDVTALLFAKTTLPFADLLVERAGRDTDRLVPNDSETRVFLHDIPFIRESEWSGKPKTALTETIIRCLKERKAVIIQGLGVVASGGVTVEQAFISYSTIFHTTFVKYFLDLLNEGFRLPQERNVVEAYLRSHPGPRDMGDLVFTPGPIEDRQAIMREICRVGRYTVEKGYVDSFFGNISYFDGKTIFISQTTSSLDELEVHRSGASRRVVNRGTIRLIRAARAPGHLRLIAVPCCSARASQVQRYHVHVLRGGELRDRGLQQILQPGPFSLRCADRGRRDRRRRAGAVSPPCASG